MKNNFTFLFISFFIIHQAVAQTNVEKWINGQVTVNNVFPLEGVNITNTSSKVIAVSDQYGHFSIFAKEGDILSLSAVNYEDLRKFINRQEFNLGSITVNLTPKTIELNEVIINKHPDITAENLGIIPKDQVKLTTAERKIYTATNGTDALLNYFSGRTKILKKEAAVEKSGLLMVKLENLFENQYYIETLKIPEELIKGFQYYCVENPDFAKSLNDKNKRMCEFLIVGLASEFNKNQLDNEK
nr:carboxypeptidase-like regulatory domain-containing protein [uncultured Flavobacterium sp.]